MGSRLGCYVLPGGVSDPRKGLEQATEAERIGLGAVWIGERYDTKDLPSLAGAISQVTNSVRIGAAITHTGLRHPMVLASMGQTLQSLTGGRFALGLGRSASWRWAAYGVAPPTLRSMADTANILRRLWSGETVTYDGPAGRFPRLRLPQQPAADPPQLLLAAIGQKTIAVAGESFDGVILHPFLTVDAVARSVRQCKDAAERAGRDAQELRCVATVVAAPDASRQDEDVAVRARAAGYLSVPDLGDALVRANGWSTEDVARYRNQPMLTALGAETADKALTRAQLADLTGGLPSEWIPSSSALGSATDCAARLQQYLDAGADEIIIHGTSGGGLEPLVHAANRPTSSSAEGNG